MAARRPRCLPGVALGCAAAIASPAPAAAASATTTFLVTMAVQATCTASATALAFGSYAAVQIDATATITTTCTNTTPYSICINAGANPGSQSYQWNLVGPSAALIAYRVYRDSGRTLLWGGTAGTDCNSGTGNGSAQSYSMYGRLPAGQFGTPGSYSDTITVTLAY